MNKVRTKKEIEKSTFNEGDEDGASIEHSHSF